MRRAERQITNVEEIEEILTASDICVVVFNDEDGIPYAIPVNFGYAFSGEQLRLYFHGAREGKKMRLMQRDNRVSFSVCWTSKAYSEDPALIRQACKWSVHYGSVVGKGTIAELDDLGEKEEALRQVMFQATGTKEYEYPQEMVMRTGVFAIDVLQYTAKSHRS